MLPSRCATPKRGEPYARGVVSDPHVYKTLRASLVNLNSVPLASNLTNIKCCVNYSHFSFNLQKALILLKEDCGPCVKQLARPRYKCVHIYEGVCHADEVWTDVI